MAARKMVGLGSTLSVKLTTASTTTYTVIGGLISLPGPDGSGEDIDTTTIDNATIFKTFSKGHVDPGEMTLSLAYSSTDTSSKKFGTMYSSTKHYTWKVTFPSTLVSAETFTGYVKSMGRAIERGSMMLRNVTIKVSGAPGFPST